MSDETGIGDYPEVPYGPTDIRYTLMALGKMIEQRDQLLAQAVELLRKYNHELSHYLCLADETLAVYEEGKAFLARPDIAAIKEPNHE